MTKNASLLPSLGLSPSASSRTSRTPTLVVLIATCTRAACRAPVVGGEEGDDRREGSGGGADALIGSGDDAGEANAASGSLGGAGGTTED
ncbi:MAG: hypothetical protein ABUL60_21590 [Myxococcales bacterium]